MGYTTDFHGEFKLNKKLDDKTFNYLVKFNETRRMKRDLPSKYGTDGEFYVDGGGMMGQDEEDSIMGYNKPPRTQPGLWCQWRPSDDGMSIVWDGGEKFYEYREWIVYIIQNFLAPQGYVLNGTIEYQGEEDDDCGSLIITDNVLYNAHGNGDVLELYEPELCRSQLDHHAETVLLNDGGVRLLLESKG